MDIDHLIFLFEIVLVNIHNLFVKGIRVYFLIIIVFKFHFHVRFSRAPAYAYLNLLNNEVKYSTYMIFDSPSSDGSQMDICSFIKD